MAYILPFPNSDTISDYHHCTPFDSSAKPCCSALPGRGVLADEDRELAVRRCESALSRVVAQQGPYLYDVRTGWGEGGPQKADEKNKIS